VNQIGRARNTGAACAGGDWIFFVDADSYPSVELFLEAADPSVLEAAWPAEAPSRTGMRIPASRS